MISNNQDAAASPFFLQGSAGRLFALYFPPLHDQIPTRAVLYFPPFAEEINKARRMATLQARRFADQGLGVLLVDPFGTADSEGDFVEARWEIWRDDLQRAVRWLLERGAERLIFWGLRLGALLAVELVAVGEKIERLILWQPVTRGETFMTQFLRLKLAADMAGGEKSLTTRELRASLSAGQSLEIAGYTLASELVCSVDALDLQAADSTKLPPIDWIEIAADAGRTITAAGRQMLDRWRVAGAQTTSHSVVGEPFWCTPEITIVPELLDVTTALVCADRT